MRTWIGTLVLAAAVTAGCSGGGAEDAERVAAVRDAGERTCAEVKAGIDAFNRNEYTQTVQRFEAALVPAREYAELSEGNVADDLLEAVEYYAALPADEYLEAFQTSAEFKRHQTVTLGQCDSGPDPEGTQA